MSVRKKPGGLNFEIYKNYMDQELSKHESKRSSQILLTIYNFHIFVSYTSEKTGSVNSFFFYRLQIDRNLFLLVLSVFSEHFLPNFFFNDSFLRKTN